MLFAATQLTPIRTIPTPNLQSLDVPHPFLHWHTPNKANVQPKQSHNTRA